MLGSTHSTGPVFVRDQNSTHKYRSAPAGNVSFGSAVQSLLGFSGQLDRARRVDRSPNSEEIVATTAERQAADNSSSRLISFLISLSALYIAPVET